MLGQFFDRSINCTGNKSPDIDHPNTAVNCLLCFAIVKDVGSGIGEL